MTLEQAVSRRMSDFRAVAESGATETTGKSIRLSSGEFVGRHGGMMSGFPEFERVGAGPKAIAQAIGRGKGRLYERVRRVVAEEAERIGFKPAKKRSPGRPTVAPHEGQSRCKHCSEFHAKGQHRFHGPGAFHKTHLFAFNPVTRGKAFTFHGSFTSKLLARKREKETPGSFIHTANGRYYVMKPKKVRSVSNPSGSKKLVKIYGRVLTVHAQKTGLHRHCDAECKRCLHKYVHDFKQGAKLLGLPDGSRLVTPDGRQFRLSNGSMLISDREY